MKTTILSVHQPTTNEKKTLNDLFNLKEEACYLSIFELKHSHGFLGIIKLIINNRKSKFILNLEGENTDYLKYILMTFALFAFKLKFTTLRQSKPTQVNIFTVLYTSLLIFLYTVKNYINLLKTKLLLALFKPKPLDFDPRKINEIYYLKTNMWFGIKAGGSIGHISGVVNSFVNRFKVKYLTCESPIMIDPNVEIIDLNKESKIRFAAPYELNQLQISFMFFNYIKRLKKKPKYIYQRLTIYNFAGALASKIFKIPFILEYNGSEVWIQTNWSKGLKYPELAQQIETFCLNQASRIITISKVLEDELLSKGIDKKRIITYPNCIDPSKYNVEVHDTNTRDKVRNRLGIKDQTLVFTFIGTFGAWHGVEFLAEAIKKFIDKHEESAPQSFKFLLIGQGVLFNSVYDSLSEEKYSRYVIFTGIVPQSSAPEYLNASDVFLSPHIKREGEAFFGSPTKLFEYMAYKKPIIASALYQIKDVFENPLYPNKSLENKSADGLLYEPNNLDQFIYWLDFCLSHQGDEIIKNISINSYNNGMKNYTWDTHVDRILS
ncbi:glycosyltransferase [Halobacteriovorax sp. JY17]|uniref:glycosyltransferase n=1 Tax=Halobacteriovorax sp. JY17 TaxID=2014617 RepID=UPI000C474C8E|nr:glycosyltransferase [Halobacteriovorax sp. JY17]PIK14674.1 MAG: hypothetical protein CES88_10070 [Halobacteriovorax sp. JY17]